MNYSKIIETFLTNLKECQQLNEAYFEMVNLKDKETQDLLHKIELDCNYNERNKAATLMKKVRQQRREAKDFVERTEMIINFINEHKTVFDKMKIMLGDVRKAEKMQRDRHYNAKVRSDLVIKRM